MKYCEVAVLPITIGNSFPPAALNIQANMICCFAFFLLCTLSWHLLVSFQAGLQRSKIRPHSRYLLGHIFELGLEVSPSSPARGGWKLVISIKHKVFTLQLRCLETGAFVWKLVMINSFVPVCDHFFENFSNLSRSNPINQSVLSSQPTTEILFYQPCDVNAAHTCSYTPAAGNNTLFTHVATLQLLEITLCSHMLSHMHKSMASKIVDKNAPRLSEAVICTKVCGLQW